MPHQKNKETNINNLPKWVVLARLCRMIPWASFTSTPACCSHVAQLRLSTCQFSHANAPMQAGVIALFGDKWGAYLLVGSLVNNYWQKAYLTIQLLPRGQRSATKAQFPGNKLKFSAHSELDPGYVVVFVPSFV